MVAEPPRLLPGARWQAGETRFAVQSTEAEAIEVCLFDQVAGAHQSASFALDARRDGLWEATVPDLEPGQLYGYRAHGPWEPARGLRFNPAKLLLDPLAAAISGSLQWHESLGDFDHHSAEGRSNIGDSAPWMPKSVVVDTAFDWQEDRPPATPWSETLIYECHVKGMTRLHPEVPPEQRGRYLGLAHPAVLEHLQRLGVTALELLPVQHFVSEHHLHQLGLTNYFGYNPIGWIAPHAGYASGDRGEQLTEFKTMVRHLHAAGLEVLVDLVFNHTAEGNEYGPTLCHRGLDNRIFYRLRPNDRRHYENFSGCGNTVHFGHDPVVELVVAMLRYWVEELHVDGFRFDLATVLGRRHDTFDRQSAFFELLRDDPTFANIKLIAEPWDVGPEGYQLGRFPSPWREWNDRFRDASRAFWRGDHGLIGEVVQRLEGSRDLFHRPPETESASLNFITSHDGFTLEDLVSYVHRHNWANGEDNRDGHQHNLSANWGVEGPTDSPEILELRLTAKRNLLATLALATGVPMLSHGDELGRTQQGNNNAYCQDSPLTWVDWQAVGGPGDLSELIASLFALRRQLGLGADPPGVWISAHAAPLSAVERRRNRPLPFGWLRRHRDCQSLVVFNPDGRGHLFELPDLSAGQVWRLLVNTSRPGSRRLRGRAVRTPARALLLLRSEG